MDWHHLLSATWQPNAYHLQSGPHPCTWGYFTHEAEGPGALHSTISHWSKRSRPFTVHLILEGEGITYMPKENFMNIKSTWMPTWHSMGTVSWSAIICIKPTSKSGSDADSSRPSQSQQMIWALDVSWGLSQLHGHGPLALLWGDRYLRAHCELSLVHTKHPISCAPHY